MSNDFNGDNDATNPGSDGNLDSQRRDTMKLISTAALSVATAGLTTPSAEAASAAELSSVTSYSSAKSQEAWKVFHNEIDEFRAWLLSQPFAESSMARAQAEYLSVQMPSMTFMYYGGSHTGYPLIRTDSFFVPLLYTTGFPNPDFIYRFVFLDGARPYRLWGKLGSARLFNNVQMFSAFFGSAEPMIGTQTFSVFDYADDDGSFEILLGPDVPADKGIRLNPAHHGMFLAFREAIVDWGNDTRMEISIELLDDVYDPIVFDEDEMAERILSSARFIGRRRMTLETNWKVALGDGVWHMFKQLPHVEESTNKLGANPLARYLYLPYDFPVDEALVIEMIVPDCAYWGTQMMDMWMQSLDYSFHQSSLNKSQCQPDDDGVLRLVVAHRDPGVPNWIDPVAPSAGVLVYRVYDPKGEVLIPTVKRIKLADARNELPKSTQVVTAEQRKQNLKVRSRASLGRYGYF